MGYLPDEIEAEVGADGGRSTARAAFDVRVVRDRTFAVAAAVAGEKRRGEVVAGVAVQPRAETAGIADAVLSRGGADALRARRNETVARRTRVRAASRSRVGLPGSRSTTSRVA